MVNACDYEYPGFAKDVFNVWKESTDKESVEKLFYEFTDVEFKDYLERCKQEISRTSDIDVVLDRVTEENTSEYCDFVKCNNCDKMMLVNHGEDICPECDCEGTFSWVEEEFEEIVYDNAPCLLAGMCYLLLDSELD